MIRRIALGLAWGSVALALVGFVLPWAHFRFQESGALKQARDIARGPPLLGDLTNRLGHKIGRVTATIRRGAETVTGELPSLRDLPSHVSGVQVPQLANQGSSQLALAVFELLTGTRQQLGLKSYAVYLVPGLALLAGIVVTAFGRYRAAVLATGALCLLVAGIGFWKLLTTNTEALVLKMSIGSGLWLSLWAYVGLALASGASSAGPPRLRLRERPNRGIVRGSCG